MPLKKTTSSKLATQGRLNIELAEKNIQALMVIRARFKKEQPFKGLRIGLALHITKETAVLVRTLRDGGAKVALCSCNPLSTQDDIAAALNTEKNIEAYGHKGESTKDYYAYLQKVLDFAPHLVIDDGCDLVTALATRERKKAAQVLGGCEETTTGVLRLKAMEKEGVLPFPMIAVNDNQTKHLMDNLYGTGQSTLDGILRASNTLFAGKTAVVAGYGSCGKGVALRLRGMGTQVIVTEVDPFRALQAAMDGHRVMTMKEAAPLGDLFVTVTGDIDVITVAHVKAMKSGAILANSGHFDCEIDMKGLRAFAKTVCAIRPSMQEFTLPSGRVIYVLGEGRLVNLAAAEGHPSEVMSLSFCGQALACEYLVKNAKKLEARVYTLPSEVDQGIAALQLKALGLRIDTLTAKQKHYLRSWQEGT
ncbi:adenosylhomocysteinase [Candidatus Peregrinibacteria bacterium]|nr:MAG: adenosylhomocysteinase [Candidatus Peregrinibacteria bacterium]